MYRNSTAYPKCPEENAHQCRDSREGVLNPERALEVQRKYAAHTLTRTNGQGGPHVLCNRCINTFLRLLDTELKGTSHSIQHRDWVKEGRRRLPSSRQCPRCVGECLRVEFAQAPFSCPCQRCKRRRIQLARRRKRPRFVGDILRIGFAYAPLCCACQRCKQQRIQLARRSKRPHCDGECLRIEFALL